MERTVRAMLKAPPQPVSMSAEVGEDVFHGGDAEVGHAEGVGGDASAGEVEGAEAGGLGHAGGVGVDGADDLERVFFGDGLPEAGAWGGGGGWLRGWKLHSVSGI